MKSVTFQLEGLRCDGCANTVQALVTAEPGVQAAAVSFSAREARVLYDPQATTEDQLVAVIERPGFRVTSRVSQ